MSYPVLKKWLSWFPDATVQSGVKKIVIKDSYTPTGTPDAVYNSDVDVTGAIKVYLEGTTVTIAGNGSGKISLNPDSRGVFAKFCGVESIEGLAQVLGENTFTNFGEWYTEKLGGVEFSLENNMSDTSVRICNNYLNWIRGGNLNVFSTERKTRIIADLQAGKPTMIRINTHMADSGTQAFHALAVIGYHRECEEDGHNCDNCDKFTIVDSGIPGTDGAVLCLAFEDLFTKVDAENTTDGSQNCIMLVSFPEQEEQQAE